MTTLRKIGTVLAASGFITSLTIHVLTLIGRAPRSDRWIEVLFIGAMVLWVVSAFLSGVKGGRMGGIPVKEIVKNCPDWLKKTDYFFFWYAMFVVLWSVLRHVGVIRLSQFRDTPPEVIGIFSGICMAFYLGSYSMLFGMLQSAASKESQLPTPDTILAATRKLFEFSAMKWIRKSPFDHDEDPVKNMVFLLSQEAENTGTLLSDVELTFLANEAIPGAFVPEELRTRVTKLIEKILERDETTGTDNNPKSFLHSLEWAADLSNANVVALSEEVICSGATLKGLPPLHGRRWIKDRFQLIGCGFLIVLLMLLIVVIIGVVFQHK